MYSIEQVDFGYKLTFEGFIETDEMKDWLSESEKVLENTTLEEFGVFVDMRKLYPLPPESRAIMEEGQKLYKTKKMIRSVVIVANIVTQLQFIRIAKETGIYEWERYIDASSVANWEQVGLDWIIDGKDPDKKKRS